MFDTRSDVRYALACRCEGEQFKSNRSSFVTHHIDKLKRIEH